MARPRRLRPEFSLTRRGDRYYVTWWADGQRERVSTGSAELGPARIFLAEFEAGWGSPAPPEVRTIGAILNGYLADRKGAVRSYGTLEASAKAVRRHLGDLPADHLTKERSRFYAARRRAEGHMVGPASARRRKPTSNGTIIRELTMLRAALRWAIGEKWLRDEPPIVVPAAPPPRDRWLTRDEVAALLRHCRAFHVRVFVMLALHTAGRSGALLDLEWDRVDLVRRRLDLTAYGEDEPPGERKPRAVVPINRPLGTVLRLAQRRAAGQRVIETAKGEGVESIKTGFRAACRRAGLSGVTPHILRHTAATWMAMRRVPIRDIALYLGHKDSRTTEKVYAKYHPDYLVEAASALVGYRGQ